MEQYLPLIVAAVAAVIHYLTYNQKMKEVEQEMKSKVVVLEERLNNNIKLLDKLDSKLDHIIESINE